MTKQMMISLAGALLLAGCAGRAAKPEKESPQLEVVSDEAAGSVRTVAEKYARGMAEAIMRNDFSLLQQALPEASRKRITPQMFQAMRSKLLEQRGTLKKIEFVTELNHSVVRDFIWKFTFVWPSGKQQEGWYFVRSAVVDRKPEIVGAGFSFLTPPGYNKATGLEK